MRIFIGAVLIGIAANVVHWFLHLPIKKKPWPKNRKFVKYLNGLED